ncbi:tryptophan--tRNA ligase [Candidatus Giovannonibacteria bacterium]|nr:tryptophan--tRNA ligase [Candidatus Giovannonibacteria bacterium]
MAKEKEIAISGIQASGNLHIGNYIGAIKQFVELQDQYDMYAFVADLHAITVPQEPDKLRKNTLDAVYLYLACGLDSAKTTIFVQSHVPTHTELGWILNTLTPMGELERMTQFKEKSNKEGSLAGLFNYPTLMAADILLYGPDVVPVGEDQIQHIELTRTLARKFNSRFGETFKEPKDLVQKEGARIMGLDDPAKKMSKSAASKNNYIGILDSEDEIRQKIKIAVTDSGKEIKYDPATKPAVSNLLVIMSQMSNEPLKDLEEKFAGKNYGEFKNMLADILVQKLSPIRKKYNELANEPESVLKILQKGAKKALGKSEATMKIVRQKIGLLMNID